MEKVAARYHPSSLRPNRLHFNALAAWRFVRRKVGPFAPFTIKVSGCRIISRPSEQLRETGLVFPYTCSRQDIQHALIHAKGTMNRSIREPPPFRNTTFRSPEVPRAAFPRLSEASRPTNRRHLSADKRIARDQRRAERGKTRHHEEAVEPINVAVERLLDQA
jgi:hypothetical protein